MPQRVITRPRQLTLLLYCAFFLALSGLLGGYGFLADPSGASLGFPPEILERLPVPTYTLPGLFLFFVLGLYPLVVIYGLWTRRPWAWGASLALSVILILWIVVEVILMAEFHPLHLIYGLLGIAMLGLTLTQAVKRHLAAP
ncbi:MAG: hypothetical protein C4524_05995 [Candidatus Zixiibacteriota bacterium]|nr:MAG: hypothetical protein C4524_05995 [candidate division Zixibacteria bacterium]